MAQFNPHVGVASSQFTALPTLKVIDFLDNLVGDLTGSPGGTINGWTLYDDLRSIGSSYPINVRLYTADGAVKQYFGASNSYECANGQSTIRGYTPYGYDFRWSISGLSASQTPVSFDQVNWYNAYYSSFASNWATATLDRPFSQATVSARDLYTKITKYVVFKQASSTKNFYLMVGQRTDAAGTPVVFTQCYETWDAVSHVGTQPSAIEHTRFFWESTVTLSATCRYISWFLPDCFALWTGGMYGFGTVDERFSYVGNLDTSGLRSNDQDAVAFIPGDTTCSGYCVRGVPTADTNWWVTQGAAQCLRVIDGFGPWYNPGFQSLYGRNQYQPYPRGRWYGFNATWGPYDASGKFMMTEMDLYSVATFDNSYGSPNVGQIKQYSSEGRRGMIKYLKIPVGNPSGLNLCTTGPANDGNTYIVLRQSNSFLGSNYSQISSVGQVAGAYGLNSILQTGWAYSVAVGASQDRYVGELLQSGAGWTYPTGQFQFLMMPIG